ncbi:hypothetical protein [Burkholderia vietnamiensis]|uniref:hypothetical protein n=1 Tax=Burkholderia vietnamiensis TaxID=60552 RepID=UPI001594C930|nr:hypothetical protein [Burkholderia vietnamiensis]
MTGDLCLNLNGIPSGYPLRGETPYLLFDAQGVWRLSNGDMSYDVENVCIQLHEALRRAVMHDDSYNELLPSVPEFAYLSGLNSESTLSKTDFEKFIRLTADFPEINRFLFLFDARKLVSSIQECQKELVQIVGEFYRTLNTEPLFYPQMRQEDGIRYNTSPTVTKLFALLTFIFVRMHSLLDYTVKLALEAEGLPKDFTKYPKLRSSNEQFGSRKRVSFNKLADSLFEECDFITLIETLRNHLIHDGLLDDMPKAYERIENGVAVEKFLLFPDMTEGRFDRFGNRNLFFSREDKINERLPEILTEFQVRLKITLERILRQLPE